MFRTKFPDRANPLLKDLLIHSLSTEPSPLTRFFRSSLYDVNLWNEINLFTGARPYSWKREKVRAIHSENGYLYFGEGNGISVIQNNKIVRNYYPDEKLFRESDLTIWAICSFAKDLLLVVSELKVFLLNISTGKWTEFFNHDAMRTHKPYIQAKIHPITGNVYLLSSSGQIEIFTPEAKLISAFGGCSGAYFSTLFFMEDQAFIVNDDHKIECYDISGKYLRCLVTPCKNFLPYDATETSRNIIAVDYYLREFRAYDSNGILQKRFDPQLFQWVDWTEFYSITYLESGHLAISFSEEIFVIKYQS